MDFAASLYVGLLNAPGKISIGCATGNCTFPIEATSGASYQTLGFESACVDVSAEIRSYMPDYGHSPYYYIPRFGNGSDASGGDDMRDVGFTTQVRTMGVGVPFALANVSAYFPEYWAVKNVQSSLYSIAALVNSVDWDCAAKLGSAGNYDTEGKCRKPFATECKVWPAIQNIQASINISILEETIVSSQPLLFYRHAYNVDWLALPSRILSNGAWESCGASTVYTPSTPVAVSNSTVVVSNGNYSTVPKDSLWYSNECVWHVDFSSQSALVAALSDMFYDKRVGGNYGSYTQNLDGDLWIKMIYRNGTANLTTMEAYAEQLARSLTAKTRMLGSLKDQGLGSAKGVVVKTETCIEVRWGWIAFPVGLVLSTLAFLAMTAWTTRETNKQHARSIGIWKSSTLAVLFGGLKEDVRRMCGPLERKSQMEACAEEFKVSLISAEDGWKLSRSIQPKVC